MVHSEMLVDYFEGQILGYVYCIVKYFFRNRPQDMENRASRPLSRT